MKTPSIVLAFVVLALAAGCDKKADPAAEGAVPGLKNELRAPGPLVGKTGIPDDSIKPVARTGVPDDSVKPVAKGGIPDDSVKPLPIAPRPAPAPVPPPR